MRPGRGRRGGIIAIVATAIVAVGTCQASVALQASAAQAPTALDDRTFDQRVADRTIEGDVIVRLADTSGIGAGVRVRVDRGVVTLTGDVPSERARARAERIARGTPGVAAVHDHLVVERRAPLPNATLSRSATRGGTGTLSPYGDFPYGFAPYERDRGEPVPSSGSRAP